MNELNKNQVPKSVAIILSIFIPISFVIFVEKVKSIAKSRLLKNNQDKEKYIFRGDLYREEELKVFLPFSFIYLIFITLLFIIIGPYINFNIFEVYFSKEYNKSLLEKISKTILVQIINLILYTGLLIQIFSGIESLYPKTPFCLFMENMYGPFIEEFVYRGFLFTLLKCGGFNGYLSAIFSSLTFSLSHFRHVFDIYFNKSYLPKLYFQSLYTLLFGFYTCYAYNYSGTILAPSILHGVCNTLQLPRFHYLKYDISKQFKTFISIGYILGIIGWIILIVIFH